MSTIIYPISEVANIIIGKNSQVKSTICLKYIELIPLKQIPNSICVMPRMTDVFIFIELKKSNSFSEIFQAGSTPKGYTYFESP